MSELVRAFVAVDISEPVREQVRALLPGLRRMAPADVKWVKPELVHLTLAFLGEVGGDFLESAREQLTSVASESAPVTCRLSGLGAFPSSARARVIWAGMAEGADELRRLQQAVERALAPVGYQPERRPFSPHLTLARLRVPADVTRLASVAFRSDQFAVGRLVLYRSVLAPSGPTYSELGAFPFGSSA